MLWSAPGVRRWHGRVLEADQWKPPCSALAQHPHRLSASRACPCDRRWLSSSRITAKVADLLRHLQHAQDLPLATTPPAPGDLARRMLPRRHRSTALRARWYHLVKPDTDPAGVRLRSVVDPTASESGAIFTGRRRPRDPARRREHNWRRCGFIPADAFQGDSCQADHQGTRNRRKGDSTRSTARLWRHRPARVPITAVLWLGKRRFLDAFLANLRKGEARMALAQIPSDPQRSLRSIWSSKK